MSNEIGGLLEPAQEERKAKKRPKWSESSGEGHARAHSHKFEKLVQLYCVRAKAADDPHHRQLHKEPEVPIIMADYCFMQDSPGGELFTFLDILDVALGMMAAISVEEKGPSTYVVSAMVEHLRAWGRKKVIFRIDGEPAIRALGGAIQHARSGETVIECRPKYSSPSTGPVENMNKELCGLVRSPLLPWLVRHCGWILCRYAVRADGRTGYSRLKGREYTAGIAIFGEAIWYKLPKVADLTKLDDRWRAAIWLGKSDRSDEHIIGVDTGAVLARSVKRKAKGKRWSERALKLVTGTAWNPRPGEVVMRRRYITRALVESYGPTEDCGACFRKSQQHSERCRAPFELLCAGEDGPIEARAQEGMPAPSDPAAPNLLSTSTVAQAGKVDTDAMETEENEPAVSSQAPAIATPVEPSVTGNDETMEQEGPESKRQRTVAGLSVCSLLNPVD